MRVLLFLCSLCALYGCVGIPSHLEITVDGGFCLSVFKYDFDHEEDIEKQLAKYGMCKNGFKITSTEYFVFSCTLGDCRGTRYIGSCKSF